MPDLCALSWPLLHMDHGGDITLAPFGLFWLGWIVVVLIVLMNQKSRP